MNVSLLIPRAEAVRTQVRGVVRHQLNAALWRITRASGEVLGYIERVDASGRPFHAKRMTADRRGFVEWGAYSDFDEAVDVLRW